MENNLKSKPAFPFVRFIGQDELKLALCLVMIDRTIGGVLIMGDRGTGKSVIVRSLTEILPQLEVVPNDPFNSSPTDPSLMGPNVLSRYNAGEKFISAQRRTPMVELPLGATEEMVCGTIDIEKAFQEGVKAFEPGLLAKANRGVLYVDEVNLLDDGLVDVILDSAACGVNTVEREGLSITHPALFIMIGSGNPGEGEMRPQMLDRFGLAVNVTTLHDVDQRTQIVLNRMAYETEPETYMAEAAQETLSMCEKLTAAQQRLKDVRMPRDVQLKISELCARLGVDGLRGDLVANRASKALVALEGRTEVNIDDVERVMCICLGHRLRKDPLSSVDGGARVAAVWNTVNSADTFEQ